MPTGISIRETTQTSGGESRAKQEDGKGEKAGRRKQIEAGSVKRKARRRKREGGAEKRGERGEKCDESCLCNMIKEKSRQVAIYLQFSGLYKKI